MINFMLFLFVLSLILLLFPITPSLIRHYNSNFDKFVKKIHSVELQVKKITENNDPKMIFFDTWSLFWLYIKCKTSRKTRRGGFTTNHYCVDLRKIQSG